MLMKGYMCKLKEHRTMSNSKTLQCNVGTLGTHFTLHNTLNITYESIKSNKSTLSSSRLLLKNIEVMCRDY